jgi:replicative DNA helicase
LHDWVVCSIEKNRSGKDTMNMEFRKMFAYSCFQPEGGVVEEHLIDERIFKE